MSGSTLPLSFRSPEGRALRGPVPADFERFYRSRLRFRSGRRIRSAELADRYKAWAEQHEAGSLDHRAIRRAMLSIGHRLIRSNGMVYLDVEFAEAVPHVADNYPRVASPDQVIERIDAMAAELAAIRASFVTNQPGATK